MSTRHVGSSFLLDSNVAKVYVRLTDPVERVQSQQELVARTRTEIVSQQPNDLRIDVSDVAAFSGGGSTKAIQYILNGPDLDVMTRMSDHVVAKLKQVPGAADVDSSLVLGKPEVRMHVLRDKAADLGVQVADISNAVRLLMGGLKVSTYEEKGEDYDVRIRAEAGDRNDIARLAMVSVPSNKVGSVSLRDVVEFDEKGGPSEINRLNRRRQVTLSANVMPGTGESAISEALARLVQEENLPQGYGAAPTGRTCEMARAGSAFALAFGLSFVFMYLILAAQFESWAHPFTILISLPLTVPFALLSLVIFQQSVNIQSALGLLVLFGVVKKNSILQVDHTNNLRAAGMNRLDAIMAGNKDRLRPILMTTIAFVAGMAPLIVSKGIGAGMNRATAGVVVGGQMFSLLLTLLATPVVYSLLDDAASMVNRLFSSRAPVDRGKSQIDVNTPSPH